VRVFARLRELRASARAARWLRLPWRRRPSVRLRGRLPVFLVGDVPSPGDGGPGVVLLLHGDVDREPVRGGSVPVVLTGLEEDSVAGADDLDSAAVSLAEADSFGDVEVPAGVAMASMQTSPVNQSAGPF